jgi:hypothetical protein
VYFERNILIKIYGPVQEKDIWRKRTIKNCTTVSGHRTLSETLKQQGSDGQGTYTRMGNNEVARRIVISELEGSK